MSKLYPHIFLWSRQTFVLGGSHSTYLHHFSQMSFGGRLQAGWKTRGLKTHPRPEDPPPNPSLRREGNPITPQRYTLRRASNCKDTKTCIQQQGGSCIRCRDTKTCIRRRDTKTCIRCRGHARASTAGTRKRASN